jgi:hypothetical protein
MHERETNCAKEISWFVLFFKLTPQRLLLFLSLERDVGMGDRIYKLAVGPQQAARTSKMRKMKNKRKIDEECTDNECV